MDCMRFSKAFLHHCTNSWTEILVSVPIMNLYYTFAFSVADYTKLKLVRAYCTPREETFSDNASTITSFYNLYLATIVDELWIKTWPSHKTSCAVLWTCIINYYYPSSTAKQYVESRYVIKSNSTRIRYFSQLQNYLVFVQPRNYTPAISAIWIVIPRQPWGCRRGRERSVASVRQWVCLCVCPRCKRKTAGAINTKHGRLVVRGRTSACTDAEVERSKVKIKVKFLFNIFIGWRMLTGCGLAASADGRSTCGPSRLALWRHQVIGASCRRGICTSIQLSMFQLHSLRIYVVFVATIRSTATTVLCLSTTTANILFSMRRAYTSACHDY